MKSLWLAGLMLCLPAFASGQENWQTLFNGKNLDGWVQRGGKAKYTVEDLEIVGTTVPKTPNSFLCTEKEYRDFILELEFKVDTGLNSGVQVRSECYEEETEIKLGTKTMKIPAGRVHGYQVEIDPSKRSWTGGIYDEGRRGWLVDLSKNEEARKAFRPNEWNLLRVVCQGSEISTTINGVRAASLQDHVTKKGFIALQVHGVGDKQEPLQVRWRRIRIANLSGD